MKRFEDCVFTDEEDCPHELVGLECEDCIKNKKYKIIEKALHDFVSLGDDFTELFKMSNQLIQNKDKSVKVIVPVNEIERIHRIMTSFLTTRAKLSEEEILYRRLIYHFFGIVVDEFKELEYTDDIMLH